MSEKSYKTYKSRFTGLIALLTVSATLLTSCSYFTAPAIKQAEENTVNEIEITPENGIGSDEDSSESGFPYVELTSSTPTGDIKTKTPDKKFSDALTKLSAQLFTSQYNGENTLVSPVSIVTALAMLQNGADEETLAETEALLGGFPYETMNAYLKAYFDTTVRNDGSVKFNSANSIWIRDNESLFSPKKEFLDSAVSFFDASVFKAPFDASTLNSINGWVKLKTDGMIDGVINEIHPESIMFLINALCFDAEWNMQYNDYAVSSGEFTNSDGKKESAEFMASQEATYYEGNGYTGFSKPYKNSTHSFIALLPDSGTDIGDFVASLTGEKLSEILTGATDCRVTASVPKFSFDCSYELKDTLIALGMKNAFDETANFSRIGNFAGNGSLCVGSVRHKTFIELSQRGTRAGAVTSIEMSGNAYNPEKPKNVILDRPFVFMIVDNKYSVPVFIGVVCSTGK